MRGDIKVSIDLIVELWTWNSIKLECQRIRPHASNYIRVCFAIEEYDTKDLGVGG